MADENSAAQQTRKRRHHTRSRNGCFACKERHVRCDEARPTCANCIVGNRECQYAPPSFPLRDRRLGQPGMPGFMVWQLPNTSVDPFDALPIKMPYKSKELFHYFAANPSKKDWNSSGTHLGIPANIFTPGDPKSDWYVDLAMTAKEPTAFRSTLLMAALHYSWKTGSLQDYENTFLYHKGESIRLVNEWLRNPDARISAACMKLIATLSVTESCIGNFPAADAHLDGMLTLLDMREAEKSISGPAPDDEDQNDEVLQRLILVAHNFSRAVKSRLSEGLARQVDLFDIWQKSFSGLAENLTALRLIPFYFSTGADLQVSPDCDAEPAIDALRGITAAAMNNPQTQKSHYVVYPALAASRTICDSDDSTSCQGCKSLSSLFLAFTEGHVSSLSRDGGPVQVGPAHIGATPQRRSTASLSTSWVGFTTAAGFYLNSVLMLWNGGQPEDARLLRRMMRMLKTDIACTEEAALRSGKGTRQNSLWFWKVFVGALTLQRLAECRGVFGATPPADNMSMSEDLEANDTEWFDICIRRWSQTTKVTQWSEARKAMMDIVYPKGVKEPSMPGRIWQRAISAPRIALDLAIDPSLKLEL